MAAPSLELAGEAGTATDRVAVALPLRCRSRRCPCCSWSLIRRDRARAFQGARGAGRVALVTLTVDPEDGRFQEVVDYHVSARSTLAGRRRDSSPDGVFPVASIDYVRSIAWKRFRTYFAREYGAVPWLRGLELTKAGIAHVHVVVALPDVVAFWRLRSLIRGGEDGRRARRGKWLARRGQRVGSSAFGLAERAGFGIVSDVQLARASGDVVRYVAKAAGAGFETRVVGGDGPAYAVKGASDLRMPKFTRRVSWSRGRAPWAPEWAKPTPIAGLSWRVVELPPDAVARELVATGHVLQDVDSFRVPLVGRVLPAGGL